MMGFLISKFIAWLGSISWEASVVKMAALPVFCLFLVVICSLVHSVIFMCNAVSGNNLILSYLVKSQDPLSIIRIQMQYFDNVSAVELGRSLAVQFSTLEWLSP